MATVVDYQKIKQDMLNEYQDLYLIEFPEVKAEIEEVRKSPKCSICDNKFTTKFFNIKNVTDKLKLIYGKDITIDKRILGQKVEQEIKTEKIPEDEWETWFANKAELSSGKNIRLMTTFFNPLTNMVTVSYNIIRR